MDAIFIWLEDHWIIRLILLFLLIIIYLENLGKSIDKRINQDKF